MQPFRGRSARPSEQRLPPIYNAAVVARAIARCIDRLKPNAEASLNLWSIDRLRSPRLARLLGLLGLLIGVLPAAALAAGALRLDVPGMIEVALLQSVWNTVSACCSSGESFSTPAPHWVRVRTSSTARMAPQSIRSVKVRVEDFPNSIAF